MRLRARASNRANISFFIFVMFFAVFGVIFITELFLLERPTQPSRSRYEIDVQNWAGGRTERFASMEIEQASPAQTAQDGVWQPVTGTRFRFYVYSAYVERRTVAAVRIIASTKTRGPDAVFCRMWLPNNRTLTLKARVQAIRENWNLKYSAAYVLCLLRDTGVKPQETVGASIAVIASIAPNKPTTNLLLVMDTEPKQGSDAHPKSLHVCVKPFHFSYGRVEWMIEWIELNRMLGVSHFYMYNNTVSDQMGCLLSHYKRRGLITLLPWELPIVSKVKIRTEGMFAAFNDCLYRSMPTAGWLLVIDTDEVVMPRQKRKLTDLLSSLTDTYTLPSKRPAAFLFRNAFFYVPWKDDPESKAPLLTSRKTRRWVKPHALKNRSKYAVRPRQVVELGNHFVWEHAPGANSVGVPVEGALLHHYRLHCEFGGDQCLSVPSIVDRTAHRYTNELWERVKSKVKEIKCLNLHVDRLWVDSAV